MRRIGVEAGGRPRHRWWRAAAALWTSVGLLGCQEPAVPGGSYFQQRIQPIFEASCLGQTAGCHLTNERGEAAGNLDLSSYDTLMRRSDVLPPTGPYPNGLLLMKVGSPQPMSVETLTPDPETGKRLVTFTSDIRHNAGRSVALSSEAFGELKHWIESGYARNGVPRDVVRENKGACNPKVIDFHGYFDPSAPPADEDLYRAFVEQVNEPLVRRCAGGQCHGVKVADLYLSCGETEEQKRLNFWMALQFVGQPASASELLDRPLSMRRGGTYHEGGDVFADVDDPDYRAIRRWAEQVVEARPDLLTFEAAFGEPSEGFRFFVDRVQPVLARKGCMFLNCHSVPMFHKYRLRGGSRGTYARIPVWVNYMMSKKNLGIDSPNPNMARLIAKNLYPPHLVPGGQGIVHRGGSLLEDFRAGDGSVEPARPELCEGFDAHHDPLDVVPAYCVLVEWHRIERQHAIDEGKLMPEPLRHVVWVRRPPGVGDLRDFDTFRGGADLRIADATVDAEGHVSLSNERSLLGGCGLGASPDIRSPAVSWDGRLIAFSARPSAEKPWRIYRVHPDGSACEPYPHIAPDREEQDGILLHDFDPAFAPDGSLVFASTRPNIMGADYGRPTRTPAAMQPNANLFVYDEQMGKLRQLTFLLNQELDPSFMFDGRVVFTTEKREPGFHQLALRRQNFDGGDYHPLIAQRETVGFRAATSVAELPNLNFVFTGGPLDATDGAGTIVVVNRSIGPDQPDRDPADRFYLHSLTIPRAGALADDLPHVYVLNRSRRGVFRSTAALPTGRILASCDLDATDVRSPTPFAFDLCEVDPYTGEARVLVRGGDHALVDGVAVWARPPSKPFVSRPDEANGASRVDPTATDAIAHILDFPMLEPLLYRNTRTGVLLDQRVRGFEVFVVNPPPPGATRFEDLPADQVVEDDFGRVYRNYTSIGWVDLRADGSTKIRVPGGVPFLLRAGGEGGRPLPFRPQDPFEGDRIQKEQMQLYPGERVKLSFKRRFFDSFCGNCHGTMSGRDVEAAVNVDVLTGASETLSRDAEPISLGF